MFKQPPFFSSLVLPLLALPRPIKRLLVLSVDISLCVLTVWLAFYLRLDLWLSMLGEQFWRPDWAALISIAIAIPIFMVHGFYRVIFRHSNLAALNYAARAFALYTAIYLSVITLIGVPGIPRTIGIIQPLLLLFFVGLSRTVARFWLGGAYQGILRRASLPKALIYGAGSAGRQLAAAMAGSHDMRVIGFLDDNPKLQSQVLAGLPIYRPQDLEKLSKSKGVGSVLLALPTVGRSRRNQILAAIRAVKVAVHTLPAVSDLAQGKVTVSDLRDLDIDDLLGREAVEPDQILMGKLITGKIVLVTGAGGSIGSELCRQVIRQNPSTLLLLDNSEHALYAIHSSLESLWVNQQLERTHGLPSPIVPLLGSVQDKTRLDEILQTWQPDTLYHAAAYKHVPLVEHNPAEGIKNNVFGTWVTAECAINAGVKHFVLVSTDKAVRPTNVMGASKRLAEIVLQSINAREKNNAECKTRFSMVRFGNVLGSSGSVVPRFRQQIRDGGPISLTHTNITRYFMTIPEAAQLVIQAGAMARGGEVYVLDMGEPIRIIDLARRMVELSGLTVKESELPEGDIEIEVVGLRPGEKLYEELLIGEKSTVTDHPRILNAIEGFAPWSELKSSLYQLEQSLINNDVNAMRHHLKALVSGYMPNNSIVDWVHLEQDNEDDSVA